MLESLENIDRKLAEFTSGWVTNQQDEVLTLELAKLWEARLAVTGDEESAEGALYYYQHLNSLLHNSDPAITDKVAALQRERLQRRIRAIEDWLSAGGDQHQEAPAHQLELEQLKAALAASPATKWKPAVLNTNPFMTPSQNREVPPFTDSGTLGQN